MLLYSLLLATFVAGPLCGSHPKPLLAHASTLDHKHCDTAEQKKSATAQSTDNVVPTTLASLAFKQEDHVATPTELQNHIDKLQHNAARDVARLLQDDLRARYAQPRLKYSMHAKKLGTQAATILSDALSLSTITSTCDMDRINTLMLAQLKKNMLQRFKYFINKTKPEPCLVKSELEYAQQYTNNKTTQMRDDMWLTRSSLENLMDLESSKATHDRLRALALQGEIAIAQVICILIENKVITDDSARSEYRKASIAQWKIKMDTFAQALKQGADRSVTLPMHAQVVKCKKKRKKRHHKK